MATPIYIFAGQSNADGMRRQLFAAADAAHQGIAVTKAVVAASGAPLTRNLDGEDWRQRSELRDELRETVRALLSEDRDAFIAGVIWVQGEGDTYAFARAESYAERLLALDDELRDFLRVSFPDRDTGADRFQWVVSGLSNQAPAKDGRAHWQTIREQQILAAESDAALVWVDPDRLAAEAGMTGTQMFSDPLHYSSAFATVLAQGLVAATDGGDAAAAQLVRGSAGHDVLIAAHADDTLSGAEGDDIYYIHSGATHVAEAENGGIDQIVSDVDIFMFHYGHQVEHLTLTGTADLSARGNSAPNVMVGNAGANNLKGGWGDDTLIGGAGADRLNGQQGANTLMGGTGDDTYIASFRRDTIVEVAGEGRDHVISSSSYSLYRSDAALEDLSLFGNRNALAVGNEGDNRLIGNEGDNRIFGRRGDDQITGGAGNDRLSGGAGADSFHFAPGDGSDVIIDFNPRQDQLVFAPAPDVAAPLISHQDAGTLITYGVGDQVFIEDVFL